MTELNGHNAAPGMEFPCDIAVKVFVESGKALQETVKCLILEVINHEDYLGITVRDSRNGRYQALSCNVRAHDRDTMDRLFSHLSQHPDVLMVI